MRFCALHRPFFPARRTNRHAALPHRPGALSTRSGRRAGPHRRLLPTAAPGGSKAFEFASFDFAEPSTRPAAGLCTDPSACTAPGRRDQRDSAVEPGSLLSRASQPHTAALHAAEIKEHAPLRARAEEREEEARRGQGEARRRYVIPSSPPTVRAAPLQAPSRRAEDDDDHDQLNHSPILTGSRNKGCTTVGS